MYSRVLTNAWSVLGAVNTQSDTDIREDECSLGNNWTGTGRYLFRKTGLNLDDTLSRNLGRYWTIPCQENLTGTGRYVVRKTGLVLDDTLLKNLDRYWTAPYQGTSFVPRLTSALPSCVSCTVSRHYPGNQDRSTTVNTRCSFYLSPAFQFLAKYWLCRQITGGYVSVHWIPVVTPTNFHNGHYSNAEVFITLPAFT